MKLSDQQQKFIIGDGDVIVTDEDDEVTEIKDGGSQTGVGEQSTEEDGGHVSKQHSSNDLKETSFNSMFTC